MMLQVHNPKVKMMLLKLYLRILLSDYRNIEEYYNQIKEQKKTIMTDVILIVIRDL